MADAARIAGPPSPFHAWNPGIQSQLPRELLPLATIFRATNVFTSVASAEELRGLTGFSLVDHVAFRPERLALHELLIRVTADFVVPDGSRIEDLGINFRRITADLLGKHVVPQLPAIAECYAQARTAAMRSIDAAWTAAMPGFAASAAQPISRKPRFRWRELLRPQRRVESAPRDEGTWGLAQIAEVERLAKAADEHLEELACRTLARVMSAFFNGHGAAWGKRELIVAVTADMVSNVHCSDAIGRFIEPLLQAAASADGHPLLPAQQCPIVINTKGASASGKSTLRPLQKQLSDDIGVAWQDFALISPDIWRKQLLDYNSLGAAYKYAGAFTADELQLIDQKLDRYMARKHQRGSMPHLLIDRFRFDSFAPESDLAGSNLLTRFGQTVYLFFVITPPHLLVERAWKRGLEFGRYKAVDDTLAHAVEAYLGIPELFFTWVRRGDKQMQFEFLDNTVSFGERPRTIAFGDRKTLNLLDVGCLCSIERFGRINVRARGPESLYADDKTADETAAYAIFLRSCVREFTTVNFADQATGRIYLRIESGALAWADHAPLKIALADGATLAAIRATVPEAVDGAAPQTKSGQYLNGRDLAPTLGHWGTWRS